MFTFETGDLKVVRRFRIAQFNGRTATIMSDGSTVTGHVHSILERKSGGPASWSITLVPNGPRITAGVLRPAPLVRAFAEDIF